jgi:predicted metal-dependent phosphoesterase TrpH/glycosyltransferase involved in cell wall biosynthesis
VIDGGPFSIVQVTPRPWGPGHELNEFVEQTSRELAERGHSVLIAAPSGSRAEVRDSRAAIAAAAEDPGSLYAKGEVRVLSLGGALPLPSGPRRRPAPVPLDVSRTLEQLLTSAPPDIVHVHDPFAPSPSSAALRHSVSLNVASFHEPAERVLSTQVARPLVEMFFGRIDARTASNRATGDLLQRYFPGPYDLVRPGAELSEPALERPEGRKRIVYVAREERGALRMFLRSLRRLPEGLDWEAIVWSDVPADLTTRVSKRVREHVRLVGPPDGPEEAFIAGADVLCLASGGVRVAPGLIGKAFAAGAVPVVSDLMLYRELAEDGEAGLLFPPGDFKTMRAQVARVLGDAKLAKRLARRGAASDAGNDWSVAADAVEAIYSRVAKRRHSQKGDPVIRRRLAKREEIQVDLHMHTDHSPDCATPVEVLVDTAKEQGLGAIAITDHNEVSGAFAAREYAEEVGGLKIIIAEEVKTAEQGEVIGLFLKEKIARGMTLAETIAEIRRQGGLVYVPHPFDRLHSVPDYEHLLDVVGDIDILEVFNPRIAINSFNEEAVNFARKYRIVPGAGSDSHVAQGLGSVRIQLRDFEGPQEFLESMREADIVRKHKNLVYVQTLKFLQTSGGRGGKRLDGAGTRRPSRVTSAGKS